MAARENKQRPSIEVAVGATFGSTSGFVVHQLKPRVRYVVRSLETLRLARGDMERLQSEMIQKAQQGNDEEAKHVSSRDLLNASISWSLTTSSLKRKLKGHDSMKLTMKLVELITEPITIEFCEQLLLTWIDGDALACHPSHILFLYMALYVTQELLQNSRWDMVKPLSREIRDLLFLLSVDVVNFGAVADVYLMLQQIVQIDDIDDTLQEQMIMQAQPVSRVFPPQPIHQEQQQVDVRNPKKKR